MDIRVEDYNDANGVIIHYGTPRHSGRYPWGSGGDETSQRNQSLFEQANSLRKQGLKDPEIARGLGLNTTQLRDLRTIVRNEQRQDQIHMAQQLKAKGMSNGAIAQRLKEAGYKVSGESQVRALLQPSAARKVTVLDNVANTLRKAVDEKDFIDVGSGVEYQLNTTKNMLRSALQRLKDEGYVVHPIQVPQLGTGKQTNMKVLVKPDVSWGDLRRNTDKIQQIDSYSVDGGQSTLGVHPPLSLSSKRVGIRYKEDGGAEADGVMYVRPGVKDVSLGGKRYAQVRVMVDGSHYIKGMAIYKDDLPAGIDVQFNTNKKNTGNKLDALKEVKRVKETGEVDQENPFGASIRRQIGERLPDGTLKVTSAMNLVNEEGDWNDWSRTLSSQFLSKQRPQLAKEQLDLTYQKKKTELDGIMALTNPSVKKKLLEAYADGADSSAVHLKAAALPRQKTQVILPVPQLKENEVHAPGFNDGEHVVLIRFPHGGTFEIPELVVNNKNPSAVGLLGKDAHDAIGIHPKVAERLSGADFDGDTVLVIPNSLGKVKTSPALKGLEDFDPKADYPPHEGMKKMSAYEKGIEMGKVSNLITDMTIQGANSDELARAVRHSMVVIDAEKHSLDYKRSESSNGIAALKKKYQAGKASGGAFTLISKATSREDVDDRKERSPGEGGPIDPKTGKKVFVPTGKSRTFVDDNGKQHTVIKRIQSTKLAETDDAHTLSSGTVIEKIYADHSNKLKALANQARKSTLSIKSRPYSSSARATHADEVATLNAKLTLALRNAPLERQAQVIANGTVKARVQANPELKVRENSAELKRVKSQALTAARLRTGAAKDKFDITDGEWSAIQAGAITAHKLDQILTYADLERIKTLATPRTLPKMTGTNISKAKSLRTRGYTWAEIAQSLGVSVSTVQKAIDEGGD